MPDDDGFEQWVAEGWTSPPNFHPTFMRSMFEEAQAHKASRRVENAQVRQIADLTSRLAALEHQVRRLPKATGLALGQVANQLRAERAAVPDAVAMDVRLRDLAGRLDAVEQRAAPAAVALPTSADLAQIGRHGPQVFDGGTWNAEKSFRAGDLVTDRGASWIAQIDLRGVRPGDGDGWRMTHKTELAALRRAVREEVERQMRKEPVVR